MPKALRARCMNRMCPPRLAADDGVVHSIGLLPTKQQFLGSTPGKTYSARFLFFPSLLHASWSVHFYLQNVLVTPLVPKKQCSFSMYHLPPTLFLKGDDKKEMRDAITIRGRYVNVET